MGISSCMYWILRHERRDVAKDIAPYCVKNQTIDGLSESSRTSECDDNEG